MKMKLPGMADSALNMTPMIDIVFQLILFFLLNLSFKSIDYRFEALLPNRSGQNDTHEIIPETPKLEVSLFRLDEDRAATARTKIKFAGSEWTLPPRATDEERETIFRSLGAKIASIRAATSIETGVIKTVPPSGAWVPHGDVMKVLDTFQEVKVFDVMFQGAAAPKRR